MRNGTWSLPSANRWFWEQYVQSRRGWSGRLRRHRANVRIGLSAIPSSCRGTRYHLTTVLSSASRKLTVNWQPPFDVATERATIVTTDIFEIRRAAMNPTLLLVSEVTHPQLAASPEQIRNHTEALCRNPILQNAPLLQKLIRFVVHKALEGKSIELKEYSIATEVFGRPAEFDTRTSSIVRTQMGKLRQRLAEIYGQPGLDDGIEIILEKGNYAPRFVRRSNHPSTMATPAPGTRSRQRPTIAILPLRICPSSAAVEVIASHILSELELLLERAGEFPRGVADIH